MASHRETKAYEEAYAVFCKHADPAFHQLIRTRGFSRPERHALVMEFAKQWELFKLNGRWADPIEEAAAAKPRMWGSRNEFLRLAEQGLIGATAALPK